MFYVAIYATVYFFAIDKIYGLLQMAVVLSVPIHKGGVSNFRNTAFLFYSAGNVRVSVSVPSASLSQVFKVPGADSVSSITRAPFGFK